MTYILVVISSIILFACSNKEKPGVNTSTTDTNVSHQYRTDYDSAQWIELTNEDGFIIDIKYATKDNFVKEQIYPCGRCFLKPAAAHSMADIRDFLLKEGFRLKLFDCYRPRSAQNKLWEKVPNPDYVAPPSEGSMHNRGVAIDLTLTDLHGKEFDMGTAYDFFGPAAHLDYSDLPQPTLDLRMKLKSIMEAHGFQSIRTEWWHYSFATGSYPLENWQWSCN